MFWSQSSDVLKHFSLSGSHHIHQVVRRTPFLACFQYLFKQSFAFRVCGELEVVASLVACESEQYDPLSLISEERSHAVFSHVRSHGEGVNVIFLKESPGIHSRRVADVTTFCVGNYEVVRVVLLEVVYGFLERHKSFDAEGLIERKVRLISHAVLSRSVYYGFVERKNGIRILEQVLRHLLQVCIETNAKE